MKDFYRNSGSMMFRKLKRKEASHPAACLSIFLAAVNNHCFWDSSLDISRKIDILQFYNPNLPLIPPSSEPSFRPIMGKLLQRLFSRSSVRLHSFLKRLSIISHLLSRCVVMSSTLEIQASACGLALTEIFSLVVVSLIVDRSTGRPAQNSIYTGHLCK